MHTADAAEIKRFTSSAVSLLFARWLFLFLTIYGFAWGTAILVLRAAAGMPRVTLLWGLAGAVPAIIAAIWLARRGAPSAKPVRALLDERSRAGGLYMAADEVELGPWAESIPRLRTPRLTWRGGRSVMLFLAAGAFIGLAFALPQWFVKIAPRNPLDVSEEVAALAEQIETLKEEEVLDEEEAEVLEEKLDALRQEATGDDPAKTWEALDHLKDLTEQAAKEAAEEKLQEAEELAKVDALTDALIKDGDKMTPQQLAQAMKELAGMAEEAAKDSKALDEQLSKAMEEALKNGKLDPEQLKELSNALREAMGNCRQCIGNLAQAGLIDPEMVKLIEQMGEMMLVEGDIEGGACEGGENGECGLAALIAQHEGDMSMAEIMDLYLEGAPGKGGVDRGRGDAPMTWKDESSSEDTKFEKQILPPASVADLKKSMVSGVSRGAPSTTDTEASKGGALDHAKAGGGSAHTRVILPRHRGTVKRYFERESTTGKSTSN